MLAGAGCLTTYPVMVGIEVMRVRGQDEEISQGEDVRAIEIGGRRGDAHRRVRRRTLGRRMTTDHERQKDHPGDGQDDEAGPCHPLRGRPGRRGRLAYSSTSARRKTHTPRSGPPILSPFNLPSLANWRTRPTVTPSAAATSFTSIRSLSPTVQSVSGCPLAQ